MTKAWFSKWIWQNSYWYLSQQTAWMCMKTNQDPSYSSKYCTQCQHFGGESVSDAETNWQGHFWLIWASTNWVQVFMVEKIAVTVDQFSSGNSIWMYTVYCTVCLTVLLPLWPVFPHRGQAKCLMWNSSKTTRDWASQLLVILGKCLLENVCRLSKECTCTEKC